MNRQVDPWEDFKPGTRTHLAHYADRFPVDEDLPLWRYMRFPVFVDMVLRSALFFPTPELLGDPLEGVYPGGNYRRFEESEANKSEGTINRSPEEYEELWRNAASLSCWTTWPAENAGMWGLYSDVNTGVAVRTTVGRLTKSFLPELRVRVRAGPVGYIDYQTSRLSTADQARAFFFKTPAYSHEREFRLYHSRLHLAGSEPEGIRYQGHGVQIAVDLKILFERIVCAPLVEAWHRSMVVELLRRQEITCEVCESEIRRASWRTPASLQ